jgi:hypothetical protein
LASLKALTFDAAAARLRALAGVRTPTREPPSGTQRWEQSASGSMGAPAALTLEDVTLIWRYVYDSTAALKKARNMIRSLGRTDLPAYAKEHDALVALVERLRAARG